MCASPACLARHGTPRRPEDLARHACLLFTGVPNRTRWDMKDAKGEVRRVVVSGPLVSDDAEILVDAAVAGLGIMMATDWLVGRRLQAGTLVSVLPRWQLLDEGAIYVVTPSGAGAASKTRAFSDWIAERLADPPWLPAPGRAKGARAP